MIRTLALGLTAVALTAGPSLAATTSHHTRHMTHSHAMRTHATGHAARATPADADHSADQLNAQSLQRTQTGQ